MKGIVVSYTFGHPEQVLADRKSPLLGLIDDRRDPLRSSYSDRRYRAWESRRSSSFDTGYGFIGGFMLGSMLG